MSAFTSFNAYPVSSGNAIYTTWSFNQTWLGLNQASTNFLYLLVTDASAVAAGNSISSVVVIPLTDASGDLTTSFTVTSSTPGMKFLIINGTRYQFMAQVVYTSGGRITTSNSSQSVVMCSTIPSVPNFSLVNTKNAFEFQLLDASDNIPTPISEFDGYGVLGGVFVTYSSADQLYSIFVANDASNNLYSQPQFVDVSLDTYEVSISSYNYTSNGSGIYWGGRSETSRSQLVTVNSIPGPVTNLTVYETMRDLSANVQQTYTYVSNTLSWSPPVSGVTDEIISYSIFRNDVSLNNVDSTTFTYVDSDSSMVAGTIYTYNVVANNANGEGEEGTGVTITGVVFPTITTFTADPSGSQQLYLQVNLGAAGFPLDSYSYDYSYNSVNDPSGEQFSGTSPYLLTGLTNEISYNLQANATVPSLTDPEVSYTTTITTAIQATPYNPVLSNATDISANPLDVSGNPSGSILMSWTNPTNPNNSGQQVYNLYRKITSSSDASYSLITTADCSSNTGVSYTDSAVVLGTSYIYKIVNVFTNGSQVATSTGAVSSPIVPFLVPTAVQSLSLFSPTVTDMSFSYTAPEASGGYAVSAYYCSVYNLSDGSTNTIVTNVSNGTNLGGLLSSITGGPLVQGNQYKLVVSAAVVGNTGVGTGTKVFYGAEASAINFTVPQGLNSPIASNGTSTAIYNGINIDWSTNAQYLALDASNATFNIYKNGSPIALATEVTGTSYLDTTTSVGTSSYYQVRAVVNEVASTFTAGIVPTPSATVTRIKVPNQVVDPITINSITNTSVGFSWNASTNQSGLNSSNLRYLYTLTNTTTSVVDASGVTSDLSANVTGLTASGIYTISIQAGISANSTIYYNTVTPATVNVTLSNQAPQASYLAIYGSTAYVGTSSGALLTNIQNYYDVSGLTFTNYTQQVALDASFISVFSTTSSTSSEFYVTGLTNATKYYLRCAYVYTDVSEKTVNGAWSNTVTGIPSIAPNQPDGLETNTTTAPGTIKLYWNVPTTGETPNTYSIQYGTDPSNVINTLNFQPTTSFESEIVDSVYKYYTTISNLTIGTKYYLNVIAGLIIGENISVSQPSEIAEVIPYGQPSVPQNFSASGSPTSITTQWDPPSSTGGAGSGQNGPMLYQVQLATDASFINIIQDVSGISQTNYTLTELSFNTTYNVRVCAYFDVQSSGFLSASNFVTQLGVTTQNPPVNPILNYFSSNTAGTGSTTQKGKYVTVEWTWDPSASGSYILQRQIADPDGTILSNFAQIATGNVTTGISDMSYIDQGNQGIVIDPSGTYVNFLNGNQMTYRLLSTYTGNNYSQQTINTTQTPSYVIPFSDPIATDASGNPIDLSNVIVPIDPSGNNYNSFYLRINKNGSSINSIIAVGLTPNETTAPVVTLYDPIILYSNPQTNARLANGANVGGIAKNQYANYIINYISGGNSITVDNTLVIESNAAGALVAKQPEGGKFGTN